MTLNALEKRAWPEIKAGKPNKWAMKLRKIAPWRYKEMVALAKGEGGLKWPA